MSSVKEKNYKSVIFWLYTVAFMVFCMVFIGGVTRLTDSGLSMVDWRPLMGAIPPLNEQEWLKVFNDYRAYPEYQLINKGMSLSDFKFIFFWEYFHRLFGRLIGLAFFVPFVYFLIKKKFNSSQIKKLTIAFILGGLQGLMGWYMVKSGLVNKPDVSHFRLASHLSLAFIIIGYIYWLILEFKYPQRVWDFSKKAKKMIVCFFVLLSIQIVYGGFVAGLDAGLTHNTFPKMGRMWIPRDLTLETLFSTAIFYNEVIIQFIHRTFAWALSILAIVLFVRTKKLDDFMQVKSYKIMILGLGVQFVLGVATLVMLVPLSLASAHQVMACLLFVLCVRSLFYTFTK